MIIEKITLKTSKQGFCYIIFLKKYGFIPYTKLKASFLGANYLVFQFSNYCNMTIFAPLKPIHEMTLPQILTPSIEKAVKALFDVTIDKVEFQTTRKEFEGDITMVIFPLLKLVKSNPVELGNKIGNYLVENVAEVSRFNVVSGFLNIVISDDYYLDFFGVI